MNFPPFGGHFSPNIPPPIHQFTAKFSQDNVPTTSTVCNPQDANQIRYPSNGLSSFIPQPVTQQSVMSSSKYQNNYFNQTLYQNSSRNIKRTSYDHQSVAQELCAVMMQQNNSINDKNLNEKIKSEHDRRHIGQSHTVSHQQNIPTVANQPSMSTTWQTLAGSGSTVAEYLSHLPASTLPLSLHHFLKYSAENIKKENIVQQNIPQINNNTNGMVQQNVNQINNVAQNTNILNNVQKPAEKKKKKKKTEKEKKPKPKPGEIRLTTALDGSTLYCCPECHMAYPEKELLEQHLVGHTLERRFVCDVCGAGLKRKDHLTRHKQSHNPERPYICTVCLKAFKRKEQLTLHFVIHSGEKRHVCTECGKGFYRKDHLRKHTRSHIARRVKAELSQQGCSSTMPAAGLSNPILS